MTVMEVENTGEIQASCSQPQRDRIINFLTDNDEISFKSQQLGETDLTKNEKTAIAVDLFEKSKLNFLLKFGKFLQMDHLQEFHSLCENCDDTYEINLVLKDLMPNLKNQKIIKNRRYEALKKLIEDDQYFTEIEMMKRNPLLYEQLVGQFLSEDEKKARDKIEMTEDSTLVKIIMEGIERDDAKLKQQEQENNEEDESTSEESQPEEMETSSSQWGEFQEIPSGPWGEFHNEAKASEFDQPGTSQIPKKKRKKPQPQFSITADERQLLKEEFVTTMYQSFLDGKDEDFDYKQVDYDEKFDCNDIMNHDQEEKYFDSEEPEIVEDGDVSSEDELDMYMSAVNQNPAVAQLSKHLKEM